MIYESRMALFGTFSDAVLTLVTWNERGNLRNPVLNARGQTETVAGAREKSISLSIDISDIF
jgi:hypothetical protein